MTTTELPDAIIWNAPTGDHPARRACQRSLSAVARKTKGEWLELFSDDVVLEDPVGPSFFDPEGRGHHGKDGISAFWDLAIAPVVEFRFTVHDSFANGDACANVATFSTLLEDGTRVDTDLVTVYRLAKDGRIRSMSAYWEIDRTMATARKD